MLSVENLSSDPPIIPCLSQFSAQFNGCSSSSCDERASLNQSDPPHPVDLPNPHHHPHHAPLPSFSIRDYVFTSRSKDIKKNWPFSLKNLQLCLKHGVKDVLPPFQSLDSVKNQSFKACTVDNTSLEKQNTNNSNSDIIAPSRSDLCPVLFSSYDTRLNNKLAETCVDVSSCRSGEENDFPSTTTSVSQSDIDSTHVNRQSRRPLETDTSPKVSVEGETEAEPAAPSVTHKVESNPRISAKKCRLIVKFGGNADRNSTEDIASNCTMVSETMGSKVCPVCKTFSSSSNTTLNAHIDQCLSVESTPKWASDSKPARHRIKPRKTRLMVDIYDTAQHCTLEELDRRNGTSWATISSLYTQETEMIETFDDGKNQGVSKIHPDDAGDVGPVYIDANGTKLRILSKLSDTPTVSRGGDFIGGRKSLKRGKASKYILKKKKKRLVQKHLKYLKLAPQHMVHESQICGDEEGSAGGRESCEGEPQLPIQMKTSDLGTLRPWVCAKRRGFKISRQEVHQPVRCRWHLPQDLLVENDGSISEDSPAEVSRLQKSANLKEDQVSSPGNDGMNKSFHKAHGSDGRDRCLPRKRVGNTSTRARMNDNVELHFPPMKQNDDGLCNVNTSNHDTPLRSSTNNRNHPSARGRKVVDVQEGALHSDIPPVSSTKSSRRSQEILNKALRFTSFRKNVVTGADPSVTDSRQSTIRKWSTPKKSQVHLMTERNEGEITWHSEFDQEYASMQDNIENDLEREETTDEVSLGSSTVLETRQERWLGLSQEEEALVSKNSKSVPHYYDQNGERNIDSLVRVGDAFPHKIDYLESARKQVEVAVEDNVVEPFSETAGGRFATSFTKSLDIESYELNNSSKAQSNPMQSIEDYRGLLCDTESPVAATDPGFDNDQGMFATGEIGSGMVSRNTDMEMEMDSEAGQEIFFPEVDPIPIPGPPGSFLPSPRDMVSDDCRGNSSLTTSRIHSSPDQHDVVDGDSSDSPISAASTISNSRASRSDFKYSEPSSSIGPHNVQGKIIYSFTAASIEPSGQSVVEAPQEISLGIEGSEPDVEYVKHHEYVKLNRICIARGSLSSKSNQPCCCQRKDRLSQIVPVNHQESQLLKRRKMASVMVPTIRKQMGCNSDSRPTHLDERPELLPPVSFPLPGFEKGILPTSKPPMGQSFKDSLNADCRFSVRSNCDSASPSASNPVLRLMGKNLMVVNKDEDASVPLEQVKLTQDNCQSYHYSAFSSISPGNVQHQDSHSFHYVVSQGSGSCGRDPHKAPSQCVDVSKNFGCQSSLKLPQAPARVPAGMFQGHHADGGISTSMDSQEYKIDYNLSQQNRLKSRLNIPPLYHSEKALTTADLKCRRANSVSHPVKEIIIIDDIPAESDSVMNRDTAKYAEGWRETLGVSSGISVPTVPICNVNQGYPYPCYHSQDHPPPAESSVVCNSNFHGTPIRLAKTSPVRWGCTSEGSGGLQRSPFTSVSSSSGHIMPAVMYYSPGFS